MNAPAPITDLSEVRRSHPLVPRPRFYVREDLELVARVIGEKALRRMRAQRDERLDHAA